jgi:peptidoglycan/xylan/chitin deacetylase (PgdA/CDA1 family)
MIDQSMENFLKLITKDKRTLEMFRYLINHSYLRVINYHNTDPVNQERFDAEIKYFSEHFVSVSVADLDTFFETKKWPYEKPGLIPAIFEGYRCHYDVMLPILNKYQFRGWFYLPSFFMDVPVAEQIDFCRSHELDLKDEGLYPDGRFALTWDEVREIAKNHEICCHTGNHFEITTETSDEDMHREIVTAKATLEKQIGREVQVFCWLYGEEYFYNERAHKHLKEAGYQYVLSNLKLEKIR